MVFENMKKSQYILTRRPLRISFISSTTQLLLIAAVTTEYQLLASTFAAASFGCTPSLVMVAVLKSVQTSTIVIGEAEVLLVGAQVAIVLLRLMTRCPHSLHPEGFIGMILATRIFIVGFGSRIWSTNLLKPDIIVAGDYLFHTSFARSWKPVSDCSFNVGRTCTHMHDDNIRLCRGEPARKQVLVSDVGCKITALIK